MEGKKNAGQFELAACALCTDDYTKESSMAERFVVVARNVRGLEEGRKGKGGEYVVRQLRERFGEGLERLSSAAKERYLGKTTRTSRCNHLERGCSQLLGMVCWMVLGEEGGSARRGAKVFVKGMKIFEAEVGRIGVLEEWLPMWGRMLPVMTVVMIRTCMFFAYEEYRNLCKVCLVEDGRLSERNAEYLCRSESSVVFGVKTVEDYVEKKMKDYATLGDGEVHEERCEETRKVLKLSARLVRAMNVLVPMFNFVDKEKGTDERIRDRWKKEIEGMEIEGRDSDGVFGSEQKERGEGETERLAGEEGTGSDGIEEKGNIEESAEMEKEGGFEKKENEEGEGLKDAVGKRRQKRVREMEVEIEKRRGKQQKMEGGEGRDALDGELGVVGAEKEFYEVLVELVENHGKGAEEFMDVARQEIGLFAMEYRRKGEKKNVEVNEASEMERDGKSRKRKKKEGMAGSIYAETSIGRVWVGVRNADVEMWEEVWETLEGWSGRWRLMFHLSGELRKTVEEKVVAGTDVVRAVSKNGWKNMKEAAAVYFLSKI